MTANIDRIRNMETVYDTMIDLVKDLDAVLNKVESKLEDLGKFSAYYGSQEWFDDREARENDERLRHVKAGVLSEDLPYDLLVAMRSLAFRMLDSASAVLKTV